MSKHFLRDLEQVKKDLLAEGGMVERAINGAISALADRRADLAKDVMEGDREIDVKEVDVETEVLKIMALHQPVAADLRFLITVLKVNNDLERMGDLAVNIAERAYYLARREPLGVPLDFGRMLMRASEMVSRSLDALVQSDTSLARQVIEMDQEVDDINRQMYNALQDRMREDPSTVSRAVHTLSVSRHLERIADLATNIAEDVVFMVDGEMIRHQVHLDDDDQVAADA